jgi:hypothetical protein
MATIVIHWKDKNAPPMEIKDAVYRGADSSIFKISSKGNEYWFNWNECWFLETTGSYEGKRQPIPEFARREKAVETAPENKVTSAFSRWEKILEGTIFV